MRVGKVNLVTLGVFVVMGHIATEYRAVKIDQQHVSVPRTAWREKKGLFFLLEIYAFS